MNSNCVYIYSLHDCTNALKPFNLIYKIVYICIINISNVTRMFCRETLKSDKYVKKIYIKYCFSYLNICVYSIIMDIFESDWELVRFKGWHG